MIPETRPVPVGNLKTAEYNPRRLDRAGLEALRRSLRDDPAFLEVRPLIVNTYPGRENVVIGGNMRLRAAKDLGWPVVPCVLVRVDPATERKWNVRDNASAGEWVDEQLAEMLAADQAAGADLFAYGLSEPFLDRLLGATLPEPTAEAAREQAAPPLPKVPITRPGDVWRLGDHRLACRDLAGEQGRTVAEELVGDAPAQMVFLDPPYGISYQSNRRRATPKFERLAGDDTVLDFAPAILGGTGSDAAVYLCCGHQTLPEFRARYDPVLRYKNTIIWDKGHRSMGDLAGAYGSQYEPILFYHRGRPYLRLERPADIWQYPKVPPKEHPTEKPVEMIEYAISHSSDPGAVVLDWTAGSGSTLMACVATGRVFVGADIAPAYVDVAICRWMLVSRQDAVRQDGVSYAQLRVARAEGDAEGSGGAPSTVGDER